MSACLKAFPLCVACWRQEFVNRFPKITKSRPRLSWQANVVTVGAVVCIRVRLLVLVFPCRTFGTHVLNLHNATLPTLLSDFHISSAITNDGTTESSIYIFFAAIFSDLVDYNGVAIFRSFQCGRLARRCPKIDPHKWMWSSAYKHSPTCPHAQTVLICTLSQKQLFYWFPALRCTPQNIRTYRKASRNEGLFCSGCSVLACKFSSDLVMCSTVPSSRGSKPAQDYVMSMRKRGFTDADIRSELCAEGYKKARVSQLLKTMKISESQTNSETTVSMFKKQKVQDDPPVPQRPSHNVAAARALERYRIDALCEHLSEQLRGTRRSFHLRAIPGDGNCMFRAVSCQLLEFGYYDHLRLRRAAVKYATSHLQEFLDFYPGTAAQFNAWADNMRMVRIWGDAYALKAMTMLATWI